MVDDREFQERMAKLRQGDEQAATWLVEHFEPELRRVIRMRLTDPFLRRLVDSADICQSVMANFFVRIGLGQFELEQPRNLVNLLVTMAGNKVKNMARDHAKEKLARKTDGNGVLIEQAAAETYNSFDYHDLLQRARSLLSAEEARLVAERIAGKAWQEIATERNETADKCRKQFRRALDRVAEQLGLMEPA